MAIGATKSIYRYGIASSLGFRHFESIEFRFHFGMTTTQGFNVAIELFNLLCGFSLGFLQNGNLGFEVQLAFDSRLCQIFTARFETGGDRLTPDSEPVLRELIASLAANPGAETEVEQPTSERVTTGISTQMLPSGSGAHPVEIVHTYQSDTTQSVDLVLRVAPAPRSEDGVRLQVRLGSAHLADQVITLDKTVTLNGIALAPGDTLDISVGPNGTARGDVTDYRFQVFTARD